MPPKIRDRIKDLRRVKASDLMPNPRNWRQHPPAQQRAMAAALDEIGFADAVLAREVDGGLELIDGHLRTETVPDAELPVLVLDVTEAEADKLLATLDPLAAMATTDAAKLGDLISHLTVSSKDLQQVVDQTAAGAGIEVEPQGKWYDKYNDLRELDEIPDDVPAITKPGEVVTLGRHTLTCGDCLEVLRSLPESSVDAVVTDPPYGIGFMGKDWDCDVPGDAFAVEALRVLKPGGHLIAFAATRTVHRLTVAIEDAGFEIRDQIAWLQWQGFPKSHDVSKAIDQHHGAERTVGVGEPYSVPDAKTVNPHFVAIAGKRRDGPQNKEYQPTAPATPDAEKWNGWGTALKPSYEPAVLARKPLEGTVADNVLAHGTGGINVDGCRIGYGDQAWPGPGGAKGDWPITSRSGASAPIWGGADPVPTDQTLGRWPANIYACPKASRGEREAGCDELPQTREWGDYGDGIGNVPKEGGVRPTAVGNHHPTVKPIKLMRWLVRLVTPPGGTVVEPFCGSGTTLIAAEAEGVTCLAAEMDPAYCDIIRARFEGAANG